MNSVAIKGSGQRSVFSEINITPLTDIFLVLLIIMMVVAPMVSQSGKTLELPKLQQTTRSTDTQAALIELTQKGEVFVDGKRIQGVSLETTEPLIQALKQSYQRHAQEAKHQGKPVVLMVKADKKTQSQWILVTMQAAQHAQFDSLMLQASPERSSFSVPQS
ncbi:MAG: ExbD/TolR family protein [Vampirovibrionales bacterium]